MKRRGGANCPTPPDYNLRDILEPVIASRAADNLILVGFVVGLLFNVVGQPGEQLEHLTGPHFSEFDWINGGEEVAELNCQ